jgi:hypothetical protein
MALAANALTTWPALRDALGLPDDSQQTAGERTINAASDTIQRFCRRKFFKQTGIAEKLAPPPGQRLLLSRTPILTITSVVLYGQPLLQDDAAGFILENAEAGILFRRYGWSPFDLFQNGIVQQPTVQTARPDALVATYSGGFVLPKDGDGDGTRTLPYDLEEAALATAVSLWRQRGRDRAVGSESLMGSSVSYDGLNEAIGRGLGGAIPDAVVKMLEPYRRVSSS